MSYGIFLGYRLAPGGTWNGEYLVADLDDFVGMPLDIDAAETEMADPSLAKRPGPACVA